jgi:hypothetical protein
MKRKILTYCLSVASVYLGMSYITRLFMELMRNFTIQVI